MTHNPFAPPLATLADLPHKQPIKPKSVKPKSVIAFLVLGYGLLAYAVVLAILSGIALFAAQWDSPARFTGLSKFTAVVAVLSFIGLTLFGVHRRSKMGQVLGSLVILLFLGAPGVVVVVEGIPPDEVGNVGYAVGHYGALLLYAAFVAYWVYVFALSLKARAYFGSKGELSPADGA